jgi:hypothetical protein
MGVDIEDGRRQCLQSRAGSGPGFPMAFDGSRGIDPAEWP